MAEDCLVGTNKLVFPNDPFLDEFAEHSLCAHDFVANSSWLDCYCFVETLYISDDGLSFDKLLAGGQERERKMAGVVEGEPDQLDKAGDVFWCLGK